MLKRNTGNRLYYLESFLRITEEEEENEEEEEEGEEEEGNNFLY